MTVMKIGLDMARQAGMCPEETFRPRSGNVRFAVNQDNIQVRTARSGMIAILGFVNATSMYHFSILRSVNATSMYHFSILRSVNGTSMYHFSWRPG